MDPKPQVSPEQFRALKILSYLFNQGKPTAVAQTFGYMQGGVTLSISDLLLAVKTLKDSGLLIQDSHRPFLSLTEKGKELGKKIPHLGK